MALINAYRRRIKRVNSQPLNEHKSRDRQATPTNQSTSPKQPTPPHPSPLLTHPCSSAVTFLSNEIKTGNNETQSGSQAISMRAFVVGPSEGINHPTGTPSQNTENREPRTFQAMPRPNNPNSCFCCNPLSLLDWLYNHLTQR
ncbi:LOW QUALITY PROTEIN: uncharacterized protein LOC117587147 [Drosophila guanche]|uniref:LOW QUALITY PROTEIN: uncharacterized protein LOC117587147 n=1 Tax=Drosophila guanche TaxID=7266 RepID=UPI0014725F09|nr:LOW QUALITY PROTEIN: uncharacterized protein LOC117587147 [Drosophila guanche]